MCHLLFQLLCLPFLLLDLVYLATVHRPHGRRLRSLESAIARSANHGGFTFCGRAMGSLVSLHLGALAPTVHKN